MLTEKELKKFSAGWRRRKQEKETVLKKRHVLALQKVDLTGKMLKEKYQAQKKDRVNISFSIL